MAPSLSGTRNLRLTPSYWRMVTRHPAISKPKGASLKVQGGVSWKKIPPAHGVLWQRGMTGAEFVSRAWEFSAIGLRFQCMRHCCRCRTFCGGWFEQPGQQDELEQCSDTVV